MRMIRACRVASRKSTVLCDLALRELVAAGEAEIAGKMAGVRGRPRNIWAITKCRPRAARQTQAEGEARQQGRTRPPARSRTSAWADVGNPRAAHPDMPAARVLPSRSGRADIACRAIVELSPSVTKRQCLWRQVRC